jgi:hypothetical protein
VVGVALQRMVRDLQEHDRPALSRTSIPNYNIERMSLQKSL